MRWYGLDLIYHLNSYQNAEWLPTKARSYFSCRFRSTIFQIYLPVRNQTRNQTHIWQGHRAMKGHILNVVGHCVLRRKQPDLASAAALQTVRAPPTTPLPRTPARILPCPMLTLDIGKLASLSV